MALSAGQVSLAVKADTTDFGRQLHDGIMGGVGGLGKALGVGLLAGAAAAVAAGAAILHTGISEALDASAGTAQLEAGIKSTGNAAGVSADGLNALASSIQGYSGQTDDSIVKSEQLLLTFTNIKNNGPDKIFDQATVASANMAAKMGGDASGSAILLGKALNDPVKGITALTRVGVSFTDAQKKSIKAMVDAGDTMGAQKIILGELNTEFGGAAEAAGNSLPGMLEKGKRAFEDMSQTVVETILPIVTPAIEGIAGAVKKASPFVVAFAQTFIKDVKEGIEKAQPFIQGVKDVIEKVATFITGTAVPAIQNFVQQFANSEGAGGALRTVLSNLYDFITGTLIPGFVGAGKAVGDVIQFFKDHGEAAKALGVIVGAVVTAMAAAWVAKGIAFAIGVAKDITLWFAEATASQTAATIHSNSIAQIIVGWIASGVAAIASGAETVAIWAMYKIEAIQGALSVVGAHLAMAGGWVMSGLAATAGAIVMAAAWLASIWPIALVIAAVVGLVIVIVKNWDTIKEATAAVGRWISEEWGKVVDFFGGLGAKIGNAASGMWDGIKNSFRSAINWVLTKWNDFQFTIGGGTVMGVTIPKITLDTPNIPLLAQGGIVPATPGGRLVRVAEGGQDEAIMPLPKNGNGMAGAGLTQSIDYDRLAMAMANVNIILDGRRVSASVDQRIGVSLR